MKRRFAYVVFLMAGVVISACERDFYIKLDSGPRPLIVEAYINNELPTANYVVLTHSQDYYDTSWQGLPVVGAFVSITEGTPNADGTISWDASTTKRLTETNVPTIPGGLAPGIYIDSMAFKDPSKALIGKPGKYYFLDIEIKGSRYTAITGLPEPVKLDSVTSGNYFMDSIYKKARLTIHYKDPDTIGNTLLFYWRNNFNHSNSFGWGAFGNNRFLPGTDDLTNGEYMRLTPNNGYIIDDTVHYHLISVQRDVFKFWDSFNKARDNGGPFATPVTLEGNIKGENVVGCFSGFSISTRTIKVK
jgi:hypothetical protein